MLGNSGNERRAAGRLPAKPGQRKRPLGSLVQNGFVKTETSSRSAAEPEPAAVLRRTVRSVGPPRPPVQPQPVQPLHSSCWDSNARQHGGWAPRLPCQLPPPSSPREQRGAGWGGSHLAQPAGAAPLHQQLRAGPAERGRAELQGAERQRQPRCQHPSRWTSSAWALSWAARRRGAPGRGGRSRRRAGGAVRRRWLPRGAFAGAEPPGRGWRRRAGTARLQPASSAPGPAPDPPPPSPCVHSEIFPSFFFFFSPPRFRSQAQDWNRWDAGTGSGACPGTQGSLPTRGAGSRGAPKSPSSGG